MYPKAPNAEENVVGFESRNTFYIPILFSDDESCIVRKGGLIIRLLFLPRRLIFLPS